MTDSPLRLHLDAPDGEHHLRVERDDDRAVPLTELLRRHGLPLNTRCGGHGVCEGCLIELTRGSVHDILGDRAISAPAELKACQHRLDTPHHKPRCAEVAFRIPQHAWTSYQPAVLDAYRINVPFAHQPLCPLPAACDRTLGVAVDVGTTTVALMLVDLRDGRILAKASAFNKQIHLGDDVLTRINLCLIDPSMVARLQRELTVGTFEPLLEQVLAEAQRPRRDLLCLVAAGNATMLHLLAGVDPSPMGMVPFTPRFLDHRLVEWTDAALAWDSAWGDAPALHLLPGAAAYVGADLIGGVIASGLLYDEGPSLLIDVGTNGEIIFKHRDLLLGCATAAGPAFEGAGLKSGIRAGRGAVSHLRFDTDPLAIHLDVIGEVNPVGLCGSAYIDLLARGVTSGLLDARGHFDVQRHPTLSRRMQYKEGYSPRLHLGHSLYVSEADIAKLMQAKAAIAAGVLTLLDHEGLAPRDVKRVYLAGGFGMHVDLTSAIDCGLLPGFAVEQVELVGNTSLAGAFMGMMDRDLLPLMTDAAGKMKVLELNLQPGFEDRFIDQLVLAGHN